MKILHILWTVFWNLVSIAIFLGMLTVASTPFQTIVVSGLAFIYIAIVSASTTIVRMQMAITTTSANRFIYLARLIDNKDFQNKIDETEEDIKEDWGKFESKNHIFYMNMFFGFVIWLIAVVSIINALSSGGVW